MQIAEKTMASAEMNTLQERKGREEIEERVVGDSDAGRSMEIEEDFNNS